MLHTYAQELFANGCKCTGMNLNVKKSQIGQNKMPFLMVGSRSRLNLPTISPKVSPCRPALYEKKTVVTQGPYIACPINIFFIVVTISRFGSTLDTVLNHVCWLGPKITNPYAVIRSVRIRSKELEGGNVIIWEVRSAAA